MPFARGKKTASAGDGASEPAAGAKGTKKPPAKKAPGKGSAMGNGHGDGAKGKGGRKRKSIDDSESEEEFIAEKDAKRTKAKADEESSPPSVPQVSAADFPPGGIRLGLSKKVSKPLHPGLLRRSRRGVPT